MPKVLLLHTGGTLGMIGTPLEPGPWSASLLEEIPEIARLAELEVEIVCNLDSSDIGPPEWSALATRIAATREYYDGFVVVHGTDTMAWTASALAFALPDLGKPVVLTGAQRPLRSLRTDARRNLADAVEVATRPIPEVCICFDGLLLRGCRARKTHMEDYRAFSSPGLEPLARMGVDLRVSGQVRFPRNDFQLLPDFDPRVAVVRVTPGMSTSWLDGITTHPDTIRGIVLVAFGSGTVPIATGALCTQVANWTRAGLDVLVTTDSHGCIDLSLYRNSRALAETGALSAERMTLEASVTKLMHALARFPAEPERRREYLREDIAGELGRSSLAPPPAPS